MAKVNKDHIDKWYDYDIDIDNRTIWIGSVNIEDDEESGVDASLSERIIKGLHVLEKNAPSGDKPIFMLMNNPGGTEIEGLAIYDAIRSCKNHVTITVFGKCESMAGYILQAADHRVMSPHSRFMMHEGTRELPSDHPRIVKAWNKHYDKVDEICLKIYLDRIREKHPQFPKRKLVEMLKFDTIAWADDAVEYGLADEVLQYV